MTLRMIMLPCDPTISFLCLAFVIDKMVPAGESIPKRAEGDDDANKMCWSHAPAESFQVRSLGYKTSQMKEPSGPAIYEMVAVDAYQSPKKVPHFAQYIDLPTDDGLGMTLLVWFGMHPFAFE